jgi:hypothetical protein
VLPDVLAPRLGRAGVALKNSAATRPFAVYDVEAVGQTWSQFDLACAVTSTGHVEHFDTREELQAWAEEWDGRLAAHSGGTYDFLFLTGKDDVLLTGSRILSARVGKARLLDTFPMMPMSLKKIGKAVGLEKLDVDRRNLDKLTRDEVRTYCERDSRVLERALQQHRAFCLSIPHKEPTWPSTAGSTAVYCAEAYEPEAARHMGRYPLDPETWVDHASAVQGGRCELWRLGEVAGPVYAYDIKSSYPSRYLEAPLAVGPWRPVSHEVAGVPAVWRVRFHQPVNRLPLLSSDGVFAHEGEGWATHEELQAARGELGAKVEVLHGWVSARVLPFGQEYVKRLYALKEAGSPFAKVCLNSLHGKFGQRLLSATYRRAEYLERGQVVSSYVRDEELSLPRWYQRPLVEAHILARARVALWRAMDRLHRAGHQVLYTDTDSIHTDADPETFTRVTKAPLGLELGQWELKGKAKRALYLAPKVYAMEWDDGSVFTACKGFPPHQVSWEVLQRAWRQPVEVEEVWGLESFGSLRDAPGSPNAPARARDFRRTLRAHPGAGKRREGDEVWYAH